MADRYYLAGPKKNLPHDLSSESLIFDTNIWLSINGPFQDKIPARAAAYSGLYKKAIELGSTVFVPQIVAGEFVNRSVMILAGAAKFDRSKCKIHQATDYGIWIKEACDLLHSIIVDNVRIGDEFDLLNLEACYECAEAGGLEFHDVMIQALCNRGGHILVTDDADFTDQDVRIITWNQRLA